MPIPVFAEFVQVSVHDHDTKVDSEKLQKLCLAYLINCKIHPNQRVAIGSSSMHFKIESFLPLSSSSIVTATTIIECIVNTEKCPGPESLYDLKCNMLGIDKYMSLLSETIIHELVDCDNEMTAIGMLICAPSTYGKTTILHRIRNCFPPKDSLYLDCSTLHSKCQRECEMEQILGGAMLSRLQAHHTSETDAHVVHHLLLLDNIDTIIRRFPLPTSSRTTSRTTTESGVAMGSFLCSLLDSLRDARASSGLKYRPYVIATCCDSSNLPPALTRPYRLGTPFSMPLPDSQGRTDVASKILKSHLPILHSLPFSPAQSSLTDSATSIDSSQTILPSNPTAKEQIICGNCEMNQVDTTEDEDRARLIAHEIARRTQGFGVVDVIAVTQKTVNYISDMLNTHESLPYSTHSTHSDATLSLENIAEHISAFCYDAVQSIEITSSSYLVDFSIQPPPPEVFGYESHLAAMLRKTLGTAESQGAGASDITRLSRSLGLRPCKGFLVHGPTGVGKTALALRVAYAARSHFKLIAVSCAEIINKVVGESERKLSDIFAAARKMAPCFLLLDNIEVLLGLTLAPSSSSSSSSTAAGTDRKQTERTRRGGTRTSHRAIDRILSTLLVELDGIVSQQSIVIGNGAGAGIRGCRNTNGGRAVSVGRGSRRLGEDVIVIATSSCHPSQLDSSLTRPGRLEQHIRMDLPSTSQRVSILRGLLKKYAGSHTGPELFLPDEESLILQLADELDSRSAAEVCQIVQEASLSVLRDTVAKTVTPSTTHHATPLVVPSIWTHLRSRYILKNMEVI